MKSFRKFVGVLFLSLFGGQVLFAQSAVNPSAPVDVADKVAVAPKAKDQQIEKRISRIMTATNWFTDVEIRVDEGVAFLKGKTSDAAHRDWAGKLAQSTEDVVAVVNQITLVEPDIWDFAPIKSELQRLVSQFFVKSPLILFGIFIIVIILIFSTWIKAFARSAFSAKIKSPLLLELMARISVAFVWLLGAYLFLRVAGLSSLAMTVLGGTGLAGLVLGFAFKDIAENFFASVLISAQSPFVKGDFIRIAGYEGYVQSVNLRTTLLMTLDGNHVQIPNATVYKEVIVNQTANPNIRISFTVGIGYQDSIAKAQAVALEVIRQHEATLADPEPLVLVEALGAATVNLQAYVWIDGTKYSTFKVRSALIRLTKNAFVEGNISMPDEAREIIFPQGVPVRVESGTLQLEGKEPRESKPAQKQAGEDQSVTAAEGSLASDLDTVSDQARKSRQVEQGPDLLQDSK